MFFNVIFNFTQTIVLICFSLTDALVCWSLIVGEVKCYYGKAFRKSTYKRKNFFAKLFLRGLEDLTSKFNIIMNFINNALSIIFIIFSILNLSLGLPIFSDIMIVTGIMQFIIGFIIALENDGFTSTMKKK